MGFVVEKRADLAGRRTFRRLDLNHLGAEAGEQEATIFGEFIRDFHDAQPRQHPWAAGADHCA
jgi:hypothetical protein